MPSDKSLLKRATESQWWKPAWSVPAAMRAARATVVIPSLFAITDKVVGDPQMALFATFGGFGTLLFASFGGRRRDKLAAHMGLAVAGSLALIIGTLVSGTTWLAAVVTVPVAFGIFFAGIGGPNAASGTTAAMLAYVLPVASAGGAATIPSRLEGWWLASAASTIAVLLLSPHAPGSRLRAAAADLAGELAVVVRAAAGGQMTNPDGMRAAKDRLVTAFTAAPFRPTGLAVSDQALSRLVQMLEWGATEAGDAFNGHIDLAQGCAADRNLLDTAAGLFDDTRALIAGQAAEPDFAALEAARAASAAQLSELTGRAGESNSRLAAAQAVHAQQIAVVARSAAADALIASRRASFETTVETLVTTSGLTGLAGTIALVRRHATFRSVWFLNSLRAAVALAAAVAVADLSGVQHGFWVVLGTLSVLRTSASSTGATAWRGLAGTFFGFILGAVLLLAIGTNPSALWAVFPVAVLVAAYAPGTTPFLVGQAAFTVTIVVLFNLLVPVGWTVGLLRIEDVGIGCAVSLVVGVLFWPRGVSSVVGDDLADAFRRGAAYLTQAVEWALSELMVPPSAAVEAASAAIRLDDAMRGFLTEQGSKRMRKEDLWALLNAASRLRLTAYSLAGLRTVAPVEEGDFGGACLPLAGSGEYAGAPACVSLRSATAELAGFYDAVADEVSRPVPGRLAPVPPPPMVSAALPRHKPGGTDAGAAEVIAAAHQLPHPHLLWVQEHLHHLSKSAQMVSEPALRIAEIRRRPWWR
ncbi:MAG: FUSC family protein [Trebonia sp.]